MPTANEYLKAPLLLRDLIYGHPKTRKTYWALCAAYANMNVVLFDGDDGAHIVNLIEPEFRDRITVLDLRDTVNNPVFAKFVVRLLNDQSPFIWDENEKRTTANPNTEHYNMFVNPQALTANTVLIFDSWTALNQSVILNYAREQSIDLSDAEKTDWDGYGFQSRLLNLILSKLKTLNCHVIVVAHETTYEKRDTSGKKIISQKIQPVSSSGPHAQTLGMHFSDMLRFEWIAKGNLKINAYAAKDEQGGSRLIKPDSYKFDDLPFSKLLEAANALPEEYEPQDAFISFTPGQEVPKLSELKAKGTRPVVDAQAPVSNEPVKPAVGKLFAKK